MENAQKKDLSSLELEALLDRAIRSGRRVPIFRNGEIIAEILPVTKTREPEMADEDGNRYRTVGETLADFLTSQNLDKD